MTIEDEGNAPADTPGATDDVRSMLTAEFEKAETTAAEPVEAAPAEPEKSEAPARARDAQGRFVKADGTLDPDQTERPAEKPAEAKATIAATDKPVEQPAAASTQTGGPPTSWAADAKATWASLSPAVQAAVLKREEEASNGIRQWSERAKAVEEVIAPLHALASQKGLDAREGLNRLLSAQQHLDRDPAGAIRWLAQSYGLDIRTLAEHEGQAPAAPPYQQAIQPLEHRLMTLEQRIQAQQEAERQQRMTSLQSEIDKFASDKPHFAAVENEMLAAIPALKQLNPTLSTQQILEKAYRAAVAMNDDVANAVRADEDARAEARRKTEAQTKVAQARAASVSIRGAPSGASAVAAPKGSVREELMAAFGGQ